MIMEGIVMVTVVVEVTKTVAGAPFTDVIAVVPYSSEVTYLLGDMVVGELRWLVGKTRTHGAEQLNVGLEKTPVPT
jgi:hypothetical protein